MSKRVKFGTKAVIVELIVFITLGVWVVSAVIGVLWPIALSIATPFALSAVLKYNSRG